MSLEKRSNILIWVTSITVTIGVAFMYIMPKPDVALGFDIKIIPFINALLNGIVSMLLIFGLYFILHKNVYWHKRMMITAFILSCIFLALYVVYHTFSNETRFGDINSDGILDLMEKEAIGAIRYLYYFLLLTHILLAAIILPFILITLSRAFTSKFDKHKKIARYTFPIWLYVTITGVILYIMIQPYY
jgi:putative membrane protein